MKAELKEEIDPAALGKEGIVDYRNEVVKPVVSGVQAIFNRSGGICP